MLMNTPPELWMRICEYACVDDGQTGRSLSAASSFLRSVSAEYRYRSLAMEACRSRTTRRLLQTLKATPERDRRIHHLYINRPRTSTVWHPWFDVEIPNPGARYKREKETGKDLCELLQMVAPHIRTLTIIFDVTIMDSLKKGGLHLELLHMPNLEELTIDGPGQTLPISTRFAPSLKRLRLPSYLLEPVFAESAAENFPLLTHLFISPLPTLTSQQWKTIGLLAYAMRLHNSAYVRGPDVSALSIMSPSPRRFLTVEPCFPKNRAGDARYQRTLELLRGFSDRVPRFILLPVQYEDEADNGILRRSLILKAQWLDRLRGRQDICSSGSGRLLVSTNFVS
ncbi:hypothetical protein PHLCEN_2v2401 [Hermanssonia centrifuga]|uniref:F-box domain-containing protein n=1 Tax=Hermanssonia centrifuga TaxID=98765 RepID=A0A2R6RM41_9APHY|nr:hypothetical protein PHLCEN_2v2401 [Hermanssonia centrifuga]